MFEKNWVGKVSLCFWKKSLMLTKAAIICYIYSKNNNIVKSYYYKTNVFCFNIF